MSMLDQLLEMGFSHELAKKSLEETNEKSLEDALDWLETQGKDAGSQDVDMEVEEGTNTCAENKTENVAATSSDADAVLEPTETSTGGIEDTSLEVSAPGAQDSDEKVGENAEAETSVPKEITFKCNQCGKLMKGELEVMFHAGKTQHDVFSESTEQVKPLTEEEKKQKITEMREKIKVAMVKKEEKERQGAIEREKKRRVDGQAASEAMERRKEVELKQIAEQRKREKQEEAEARRRVLEQIRHDREARKGVTAGSQPVAPDPVPAPASIRTALVEGEFCNIQIRLPDGSVMKERFKSSETLAAVRLWVELKRKDPPSYHYPFALMVPFPRQVFSAEDMEAPLKALGLVPSACLVVTRAPSA